MLSRLLLAVMVAFVVSSITVQAAPIPGCVFVDEYFISKPCGNSPPAPAPAPAPAAVNNAVKAKPGKTA